MISYKKTSWTILIFIFSLFFKIKITACHKIQQLNQIQQLKIGYLQNESNIELIEKTLTRKYITYIYSISDCKLQQLLFQSKNIKKGYIKIFEKNGIFIIQKQRITTLPTFKALEKQMENFNNSKILY